MKDGYIYVHTGGNKISDWNSCIILLKSSWIMKMVLESKYVRRIKSLFIDFPNINK